MLLGSVLIVSTIMSMVNTEGQGVTQIRPYVFPIPFELPNRNDRAQQCWMRIEDVELIETITVYCTLAREFLQNYIRDYNSRKMLEDDVDVSLWSEEPRNLDIDLPKPAETLSSNGQKIKDWKMTTVLDPTTRTRLYISQKADCHLIMYSRDGVTNYRVECAKILYFVNYHMNSATVISSVPITLMITTFVIVLF